MDEAASSWLEYSSGDETVHKWWVCPKCGEDALFIFNGGPPWPPLDLTCPHCHNESPMPWAAPPMIRWTCQECGTIQSTSKKAWNQIAYYEKKWSYPYGSRDAIPSCLGCGAIPKSRGSSGGVGLAILGGIFSILAHSFADSPAEKARKAKATMSAIQAGTDEFDRFLHRIPAILAERQRLAAEQQRQAEEEARKRQKQWETRQRQMRSLSGLRSMSPLTFELAVGSLLKAQGWEVYGTPATGDSGIDFIATKADARIAVQCKRYKKPVGERVVREFYGAFAGVHNQGILFTTSSFTPASLEWAKQREGMQLIDGEKLAALMVDISPELIRRFPDYHE